jgi:2-oxoglutarate/2-oxoacid ferredoxin oxidoreductase subunit alpha
VLSDLDIGMQDWLTDPLKWDENRRLDRGKVVTREELDAGKDFGRYLDVDGDGIPFRTYPGTHPTKGSFFTRGTTKDRYARYTEEGPAYVDNMQRLLRKFETAKELVPAPVIERAAQPTRAGVIWFGSTGAAMAESLAALAADGIHLDRMRLRAFPFADAVTEFIAAHDKVFVVEQNRDAQLRMMLVNECGIDPDKLIAVLHYDGTPVTARFITEEIAEKAAVFNVKPMRKVAS